MDWKVLIGKGWAWGPQPERWYQEELREYIRLLIDGDNRIEGFKKKILPYSGGGRDYTHLADLSSEELRRTIDDLERKMQEHNIQYEESIIAIGKFKGKKRAAKEASWIINMCKELYPIKIRIEEHISIIRDLLRDMKRYRYNADEIMKYHPHLVEKYQLKNN